MAKKIETNHEAPKFKVNDRVTIAKDKNIFNKSYIKNWSRETFIIDSVLKANPGTYKLKDLNVEKNNWKFLRKGIVVEYIINGLLSRTRQSY